MKLKLTSRQSHIKAEPGTQITVSLDQCDQPLLTNGTAKTEISDLTIKIIYPKKRRKEAIDFVQRIFDGRKFWRPRLTDEKTEVNTKRVKVLVDGYRHWAPGVGSVTAGAVLVKTILSLKKLGYRKR